MLLNIVKQTPYIYYNFFILGDLVRWPEYFHEIFGLVLAYLIPAYPGWVIEKRKVNCRKERMNGWDLKWNLIFFNKTPSIIGKSP